MSEGDTVNSTHLFVRGPDNATVFEVEIVGDVVVICEDRINVKIAGKAVLMVPLYEVDALNIPAVKHKIERTVACRYLGLVPAALHLGSLVPVPLGQAVQAKEVTDDYKNIRLLLFNQVIR
jgi:hypothetical protein